MKDLLAKIPQPTTYSDSWQGYELPPVYEMLAPKEGEAWFVDGGNASILEAPHFSVQKLRAAAVKFPKKEVKIIEDVCLITWAGTHWQFTSEKGLVQGTAIGELMDAITHARQQLEHQLAQQLNGTVVLDGDIAPDGCIALQKTVSVLTENGFPLSAILTAAGPWCAPLGELHAVKLHERARHVFLVHGATKEQLHILAHASTDAVFPGYPYGLVLADKLARVSKEEQSSLKITAKAMLKELRSVEAAMAASDSHDILDSM